MRFSSREAWQGAGAGALAAVVVATAAIAGAVAAGEDAVLPFRMFSSLWFGDIAFREHAGGPPRADVLVVIGTIVHVTIGVLAGIGFALIASAVAARRRLGLDHLVALGVGYGLALWALDVQILGRIFYPWFLELPQGAIATLHALGYGLPVGVLYRLLERRAPADRLAAARG